jgi:hypothetical protein
MNSNGFLFTKTNYSSTNITTTVLKLLLEFGFQLVCVLTWLHLSYTVVFGTLLMHLNNDTEAFLTRNIFFFCFYDWMIFRYTALGVTEMWNYNKWKAFIRQIDTRRMKTDLIQCFLCHLFSFYWRVLWSIPIPRHQMVDDLIWFRLRLDVIWNSLINCLQPCFRIISRQIVHDKKKFHSYHSFP